MYLWTLGFLLGVLLLQTFAVLPPCYWIIICFLFAILAEIFLVKKYKILRFLVACLLGFSWVLLYVSILSHKVLPANLEGKRIEVHGMIVSIPHQSSFSTSFLFATKNYGRLKLSWMHPSARLYPGDEWNLHVKLKRIHGEVNPGGFDYEAWALQEGILATGYVDLHEKNLLLHSHWYMQTLHRIRQSLLMKIENLIPSSQTSPWIIALALGERKDIASDQWQVLRNTGTNHLMAIAGLHVGCIAGLMHLLVSFIWRRVPYLPLFFPAQQAGAVASLMVALIYSALAGFSLPTQRACFMLFVFLWLMLKRKKISAWNGWCIALLGVLLLNPLSVLIESFWLSFGSVAFIIYGMTNRLAPNGLWWKWGRIQWVIAVGLIPLSIWLFQQCSLVSFLANSITIPIVGFMVVPSILLACFLLFFSEKCAAAVFLFSDKLLGIMWKILTYFSKLHWAVWYHYVPSHFMILLGVIGVILLLLPAGFPGRWLGFIWFLPLVLFHPISPKHGEFAFTLLDVGQGLSAVVQTAKHILVFDAGAKFSDQYDMGESVVVPFLRTLHAKKVDMLMISHGDNDHIGGVNAIANAMPILQTKTSVPEKLTLLHAVNCLQGDIWQWDGVKFEVLYPSIENSHFDNNSSCVLRVSNQWHSILLTGDIEKYAEKYLHEHSANKLASEILIAPHHGSKTSAVENFLQDVHPNIVLFPIGYRNRYHFPHATVLQKYRDLHVSMYDTVTSGAITFAIHQNLLLAQYRQQSKHYWYSNA